MKGFTLVLTIVFILGSSAFVYVILFLPPRLGGNLVIANLAYFFLTGFASLAAGLSLVLYSASLIFEGRRRTTTTTLTQRPRILLRQSLRRGLIAALSVTLVLLLRLLGLSNMLNLVLVFSVGILAEVYFSNK